MLNPFKRFACSYVLCFALTLLFVSCQSSTPSGQSKQKSNANEQSQASSKSAESPDVQVYVDDAMLKKPYAIIGGTVQNVGAQKLENLTAEIELKRRADDSTEMKEIKVEPKDLGPGEQGRYSLKILSDEWSSSKIVRLRSNSRDGDIAFKTLPGARRPPERLPDRVTHIVPEPRPKTRGKGEDFINTPDHPIPVP
ncbi:MAG: hypothetical protein LC754_13910 [Acidobacteria bacterium]|nr:hypothetical protein [Acidobacteriota bacterium]